MNKILITLGIILFLAGTVYAFTPAEKFNYAIFGTLSESACNEICTDFNREIGMAWMKAENKATMYKDLYLAKPIQYCRRRSGGGSSPTPTPVEEPIEEPEVVCTAQDYMNVKQNMGSINCTETNGWCNGGDMTKDGEVNAEDTIKVGECLN